MVQPPHHFGAGNFGVHFNDDANRPSQVRGPLPNVFVDQQNNYSDVDMEQQRVLGRSSIVRPPHHTGAENFGENLNDDANRPSQVRGPLPNVFVEHPNHHGDAINDRGRF